MEKNIALVTGANRGLGFGTAHKLAQLGYHVLLASRDAKKGMDRVEGLKNSGLSVDILELDVASDESVKAAAKTVTDKWGYVNVLVNNAGIMGSQENELRTTSIKNISTVFETNTLGVLRVCQAFIPLLKTPARIVNLSSGMGQLSDMGTGWPAYRISKTALNAVTKILANELRDKQVKVNAVCPGWVRTDMGGPDATRDLDEGVASIVWAATLPDDGPSGGFFRDGKPLPW